MGAKNASPMKFAHWVSSASGGLVVSKVPQRTDWGLEYNIRLAKIAEEVGFEYALTQIRFMGSYGAEYQHDALIFSTALLAHTETLNIITGILPGMFHPGVVAKHGATADQIFNGRWAINVVSGWCRAEYDALGVPWVEHDERYVRSQEFIEILRGAWTEDDFSYAGKYWKIDGYTLKPKPLVIPGRPTPEIFQGGNSLAAQRMAASVSDWYCMNGNTPEGFKEQINYVTKLATAKGRTVKFVANAFVIARETEAEAQAELERIVRGADTEAVENFRIAVKEAGQASKEGKGMWVKSTSRDLIQYNDGFNTNLVGTPEQIALRIYELRKIGVDMVLCGFLHFHEETRFFGERVIPLVRELERAAPMKRQAIA
ncbi:FMNH2-dependent dimethyl sulfone monooxygenase [Hyphomicrobium facile]|uniref:FMNH2-dependent dimethyl sulfone monooxygenase n=2 Tax=Hyphomicrobium facile TaxID=51670 RepID=A0A1I7NQ20_9HYPH|nr:FMNH2-dependent dimethyl sulfone monooxygenase [Hyphomicrobium facile]